MSIREMETRSARRRGEKSKSVAPEIGHVGSPEVASEASTMQNATPPPLSGSDERLYEEGLEEERQRVYEAQERAKIVSGPLTETERLREDLATQVNEVTGLRAEIATLSARLDDLEKQKRAEAKRARDEPRHDDEGPGHKQNRAERKWSWKGFSHIGEELFDILADPRRNAQFRAFMHEPLDLLAGCPPLESRYGVIRASPLTRSAYTKVRDSIEGKGEVDWSDDLIALTLRELVAIFFVARDAMSPVSLRIYLSVAASGADRARTLPEASFRKATIDSAVTRSALSNAPTSTWYVDGTPDDIASGEALESKDDYRRWVRERKDGGTGGLTIEALAASHRSVTTVNGPSTFHNNRATARPRTFGAMRNPTNARGPIYVGDRCLRCGKKDHRAMSCGQPHPNYNPRFPYGLLDQMSHGMIPLP
jgi:regulator of replication initiation timing